MMICLFQIYPTSFEATGFLETGFEHLNGTYRQTSETVNGSPAFVNGSLWWCCKSATGEWWLQGTEDKGRANGWARCTGIQPQCSCSNAGVVTKVLSHLHDLVDQRSMTAVAPGSVRLQQSDDHLRSDWLLLQVAAYALTGFIQANVELHAARNQWQVASDTGHEALLKRRGSISVSVSAAGNRVIERGRLLGAFSQVWERGL